MAFVLFVLRMSIRTAHRWQSLLSDLDALYLFTLYYVTNTFVHIILHDDNIYFGLARLLLTTKVYDNGV